AVLAFIRPLIYIFTVPFLMWQFANWRNDEYILDKDRLITLETLPFHLDETRKDTEIRRVVDATVRVKGIIANLLRFGDVIIKTPGEGTQFIFEGVPNPFDVHQEIMHRIEADREREQQQWDRDIQEWLAQYDKGRQGLPQPATPAPPDLWW